MSRLVSLSVWLLAATYVVSLIGALSTTLRAGSLRLGEPGAQLAGPNPIVLSPLRERREARHVETRLPGVRVRRLCSDGRCEVLAGRDSGFELLASYPADRPIALDRSTGRLHVREVGAPAHLLAAPSPTPWWTATLLLGGLLLVVVFARTTRLAWRLGELSQARDAIADAQGNLHFLDDRLPRTAPSRAPLSIGPATGLCPEWVTHPEHASYRAHETPAWHALSGRRAELLVRAAEARATTLAVGALLSITTLAAFGALLA